MNKEFLASTSVFAEMANSNVDLQKIINEFIINTYILNHTYSQNSTEIRSELVKHFDIDIPEAIIRTQLKRLKKEGVVEQVDGQFILNPEHKSARTKIGNDVEDKKVLQNRIFTKLSEYIEFRMGALNEEKRKKLESSFIEYLFDNTKDDEFSTLISAFIVKNENDPDFLKELNLIREGATILKGLYYTTDFNNDSVWKNKLTIFLDTEHLLSLSGLNGETFKQMLLDFYNLVRDINAKTSKKSKGDNLISLKYTANAKSEVEKLFYVARLIIEGKATLQPGKTAIKNIADGCSQKSDITRKTSEFFTALKTMGIYEAEEIDLYDNTQFNIVDEKALEKYSNEKSEDEINKILEEFTYINVLRKGRNNRGFEDIGFIIMTGDRVTRSMSYDNELKITGSDFSFATDVYYVTQRLWFKLNKGLGFQASLPSTLNIVNKARVIISSQINSSVRLRFEKLEKEIKSGARTTDELQEYYLRLRANTFSPENISSETLEDQISFIYNNNDLENYLRNRSAEKSALKERDEKVKILEEEAEKQEAENNKIRKILLESSENTAIRRYSNYKNWTKALIALVIGAVFLLGYALKGERDSNLSVVAYIISAVSLFISAVSWRTIDKYLKNKAFKNYLTVKQDFDNVS